MKNLYGTIWVNKKIEQGNEEINKRINYYKIEEEKYGFEIEENYNNKIETTNKINITDREDEINCILNTLIYKEIMPYDSDIIEDLVKKYT